MGRPRKQSVREKRRQAELPHPRPAVVPVGDKPYLNEKEAVALTTASRGTLLRARRSGLLTVIQMGGRIVYERAGLLAFMDRFPRVAVRKRDGDDRIVS